MEKNENGQSPLKSRPLSYVNLSCSVNGYSELTCYNSDARRDLRSRETSRDRIPLFLNKSRDGSPLRPSDIPSASFSTLGGLLSPVAVMELNQKFARGQNGSFKLHEDKPPVAPPRSKSVDRGYLKREKSDRQNFLSSFLNNNNGEKSVQIPIVKTGEKYSPERGRVRSKVSPSNASTDYGYKEIEVVPPVTPDNTLLQIFSRSASTGKKSFVQQRIERLYGPGALARNYLSFSKSPKKPIENNKNGESDMKEDGAKSNGCATPPVFRHLRPEFREQLSVKKISPAKSVSKKLFEEKAVKPLESSTPAGEVSEVDGELFVKRLDLTENGKGAITLEVSPEGHKFLKILRTERERITNQIREAETYLTIPEVDTKEEVKGRVLAAVGKAKLLLAQKFEQFAGLCNKNIKPPADDPFPTTGEDLAGFWDMVSIQVEHINGLFEDLNNMKKANWDLESVAVPSRVAPLSSAQPAATPKRRLTARNSAPIPRSAKAEEAAKAREESRRKLMEMRKNMTKSKDGAIEIFA